MSQTRSDALPLWLALPALLLGFFAMAGAAAAAAVLQDQGIPMGFRSLLAVAELLLVLPSLLFVAFGPGLDSLRLGGASRGVLLLSVFLGCTLWLTSAGLLELQSVAFPPSPEFVEAFRQLHAALKPAGPWDAMLSILAIAVIPAVCEELIFRGVILPAFARHLKAPLAVLASALVFACIHIDRTPALAFDRVPFALVMGIALGAIRIRTGSLLPPVLAHATVNTLTFAIAPLVDKPEQAVPQPEPLLGLAFLVAGAIGTVLLLRARTAPRAAPLT